MINLIDLYEIAEKDNIKVDCYSLKHNPSLPIMDTDEDCFIAIDPMQLMSENDERMRLAHELGHCKTGAFYDRNSRLSNKNQCERKAEVWAIKKLIPKDEIKKAVKFGYIELWELAEYFGVAEDFMSKAIDYYKQGTMQ